MAGTNCSARMESNRSFKAYPAYKDSHVDWLGLIPSNWHVKRLRYVAPMVNERVGPAGSDLPYLALEQIEGWTGRVLDSPRGEGSDDDNAQAASSVFRAGDVLFGKLRPYLAKVVLAQADGQCSTELLVLRSRGAVTPAYLAYQVISQGFIDWINAMTYGTKMPRANPAQVAVTGVVTPPLSDQRAIAAFLDRETARIDALVTKKERLIELLQEQRTGLITRAVTKGLDPNVPMKDSGVEWVDEVPAHWNVVRADAFVRYEKNQVDPSTILDEVVFHYSIPSVQETGDGALEPPSGIDSAKLRIVGERLLVSKLNPRKGVVLIASEKEVPTLCSTEFVPLLGQGCDLRWAFYLFLAESTRQRLSAVVRSATRSHQRAEVAEIVKMWHGVPPVSEQRDIAVFLDRKTARIDTLVNKIRDAIDRLKEFRTSLIAAVVTGKIDVREEVA